MATNGIDVYVKMPSGRATQYDVRPTQTILHVCELVAKDEGVDATRVRLKYQGKTLDKNKTVGQYGVRAETILKVEILIPKSLDLVIDLPEGIIDEMVISNLESVKALHEKIGEKLDVDVKRIKLKISGKPLPCTSSSLMDSGVVGGSTVVVQLMDKTESREPNSKGETNQELDNNAREEILSSFDTRGRNVEVVFSFDTTGSMYQYLTEVRSKLKECCRRLLQSVPNIRIGIIAQGDYCDQSTYVIKQKDLTSDLETLIDFASTVETTSGGDSPECYEWVLRKAQQLDWSDDSAKALVVIGDLVPHPPSYTDQNISWREELQVLTGMDVKVYGVQAGNQSAAANFYKEISEVSGGCYISLKHIDVITDMFLAVCYRESDDALLENFEEEVANKGDMTEAKQEMFSQLKKKEDTKEVGGSREPNTQRYVADAWWDYTRDHGAVQYTYNSNTDEWKQASRPASTFTTHTSPSSPTSRGSARRKGRKCLIM